MLLTSNKTVSVDAQGRITLPADMRKVFEDTRTISLIYVNGALWGFTPEAYEEWLMSCFADGYNPRSAKDNKLRRGITSKTTTLDIDKAGRIAISKIAEGDYQKLNLGTEAVVVGVVDHIEIYNAATWSAEQAEIEEDLDALLFNED